MNEGKEWIYRTNIYEVNLRQYTEEGSFRAFAAHLPRLKKMGVETLWFMPVTPIAEQEKKGSLGSYYACSDYRSTNPEFGSLEDFKALVSTAHQLEMKVIIDWVANHTGLDHVWTKTHPDWYERDPKTGLIRRSPGMEDIIELDYTKPNMRKEMIECMKFWVKECDIDGFRCDLAFWVELDFWQETIPQLNALKPLFWLAEMEAMDHPDYMQVFDAAYSWTWMHKTEEWYKNKLPLAELIRLLDRYENTPGIRAWFTSNHDENSWNGSEFEKYGDAAMPLAVFSSTWPGIPLVYSGQEIPNKKRLKFFDKDAIDWSGALELQDFYRRLLTLHLEHRALDSRSDLFPLHTSADATVLAFLRKAGGEEVMVLLNLTDHATRFTLLDNWVEGNYAEIFSGAERALPADNNFELKAWDYLVYTRLQAI